MIAPPMKSAPAEHSGPEERLRFRELARGGARITRSVPAASFRRLADALAAGDEPSTGSVGIELTFAMSADGDVVVRGRILTQLAVFCNGCAETLPHTLDLALDVVIAASAERASGLRGRDVVMAETDVIVLGELVEDELLLGLGVGRRDEDTTVTNDRAGAAVAEDRDSPDYIFRGAPVERRVSAQALAVAVTPAPRGPIAVGNFDRQVRQLSARVRRNLGNGSRPVTPCAN